MPETDRVDEQPAYLSVSAVRMVRGGQPLLDDVDLHLDANSLSIIMGANGSGKSLLLRVLHGLIEPDQGKVLWRGAIASPELRLHQAMVFQKPVLLRRSVAANIDYVLKLRGRASAELRDELLERVSLLPMATRPARLLSGGEQQRLALARALALQPRLIMLDEPTASLDPASSLIIEQIVSEIKESGSKVIFVTHDIGQAKRLADDVLFMHRGRIVEHTDAPVFFDKPASEAGHAYLQGQLHV